MAPRPAAAARVKFLGVELGKQAKELTAVAKDHSVGAQAGPAEDLGIQKVKLLIGVAKLHTPLNQ